MEVTTPSAYQVVQRKTASLGDIVIGINLPAGTYDVEARYAGGAWTTIATSATGQIIATLADQPIGDGTLEVRRVGASLTTTLLHVGVGEVFTVAGQSNASGYGINNQVYTSVAAAGRVFGNDYIWRTIVDPVDTPFMQIDLVSKETSISGGFGSVWPLVASQLADILHCPIAIIPTPLGGTTIDQWQPGADHFNRLTLFGSMQHRSLAGVRAILVWEGESDALNGTSRATFNSKLDTFANTAHTDLSVKTMWAKLQICPGVLPTNEAAINAAIGDAWADNANVLTGPDLSDITAEDDFHIRTNGLLATVAARWVAALQAEAVAEGWGW